jgi:hypothetical protein
MARSGHDSRWDAVAGNAMHARKLIVGLEQALLAGALGCLALAQATPTMPTIEGESLASRAVRLPDATRGKVAILIFGFTKASREPTSAWAAKIQTDLGSRAGFEMYQLPVLEDVPRLIRGMVVSSMKKGVRDNMRDHFVPILQHESELKKFVSYVAPIHSRFWRLIVIRSEVFLPDSISVKKYSAGSRRVRRFALMA